MKAAIDILKESTGVRHESRDASDYDRVSTMSFLQLPDPIHQAVLLLKSEAAQLKSKDLGRLADMMGTVQPYQGWDTAEAKGPFHKVKQMIQKMIFRLQQEQTDEDKQKHWCDQELDKTNENLKDKSESRDRLQNTIETIVAELGVLASKVADNSALIKTNQADTADLKEERQADYADNQKSIADAKEGQNAVAKALAVLKKFYADKGELDQHAPTPELTGEPSTWGAEYHGVSGAQKLLAMMATIESDFSRMEATVRENEETETASFNTLLHELETEQARLSADNKAKTERETQLNKKLAAKEAHKGETQDEIDATNRYLNDLQKPCVAGHSYEERKSARSNEIEALHSANGVLHKAFESIKN